VGWLTHPAGQGSPHRRNRQALIELEDKQHKPCKDGENQAIKITKTKWSK
jgi:hypothetical protein